MSDSLIIARGLTKKFGDFVAVDAIDFDVKKGESFGLLGPNGAGKSTTMRIIAATSQRSEGTITVLDRDPEEQQRAYDLEPRQVEQIDRDEGQQYSQYDSAQAAEEYGLLLLLCR